MTITLTISTLASIGTAVNAADVTTPDNELLAHVNNIVNAAQDAEAFRFIEITTPSTPASTKWKMYFTTTGLKVLDSAGNETALGAAASRFEARLTLTSGLAITTADVTAATSIYLTPFKGNKLSLYDGTKWIEYTLTEKTLSLALLTASTPHDVFVYVSGGVLTLEAVAWTNDTTRATALTTQDGIYVKSGTTSKRYCGTFRTTSTIGQTEDSMTKRFLWNYYNQVERKLLVTDGTNSWSYGTATWRSLNNSTANRVEFVTGVLVKPVNFHHILYAATQTVYAGIALDATNTTNASIKASTGITTAGNNAISFYSAYPAVGYHYLQLTEKGNGTSATIFGDGGATDLQAGGIGEVWG